MPVIETGGAGEPGPFDLGPRNADEARYLDLSSDGFLEYDPAGQAVWYAPGWKTMLGFDPGELPDTIATWRDLSIDGDFGSAMTALAPLETGKLDRTRFRVRMRRKDGVTGRYLVNATAIPRKGRIIVTAAFSDITGDARGLPVADPASTAAGGGRAGDGMLCHLSPGLEIIECDDGFGARFDMPAQGLAGRPLASVAPARFHETMTTGIVGLSPARQVVFVTHEEPSANGAIVREDWTIVGRFDGSGSLAGLTLAGRDVSESSRMEALFHEAIENLPMAFRMYDENDRLVIWNQKYEEFFSYVRARDSIRGMTYAEILRLGAESGAFPGYLNADDKEAWLADRIREHRGGDRKSFERRMSDGRHVRFSEYRTIEGYTIGLREDVTERRTAQILLQEVIEQVPGAISLFDADDCLVFCNEEFRRLFTGIGDTNDILGESYRMRQSPGYHRQDLYRTARNAAAGRRLHARARPERRGMDRGTGYPAPGRGRITDGNPAE